MPDTPTEAPRLPETLLPVARIQRDDYKPEFLVDWLRVPGANGTLLYRGDHVADQMATVIAERDAARREAETANMLLKLKPAPMADCPVYCKTALDLQAERDALRASLQAMTDDRDMWMRRHAHVTADAVIAKAWPEVAQLIASTEVTTPPGAAILCEVMHLTDAGREALTAKGVKSLPPARQPVDEEAEQRAFEAWWPRASHRTKYTTDHPAYLAAREAWLARSIERAHGIARADDTGEIA